MEPQTEQTDKVKYSILHAQERVWERYNLFLTREDLFNIVSLIHAGESDTVKFIRRQSNYRTIWKINYEDHDLFVVYNSRHKVIATFLTKFMVDNPKRRVK